MIPLDLSSCRSAPSTDESSRPLPSPRKGHPFDCSLVATIGGRVADSSVRRSSRTARRPGLRRAAAAAGSWSVYRASLTTSHRQRRRRIASTSGTGADIAPPERDVATDCDVMCDRILPNDDAHLSDRSPECGSAAAVKQSRLPETTSDDHPGVSATSSSVPVAAVAEGEEDDEEEMPATTATAIEYQIPSNIPIPPDPRMWSRQDVHAWLRQMSLTYNMADIETDRFPMNGKALCLMKPEMFLFRVPRGGRLLHTDFQTRLLRAVHSAGTL